MIKLTLKCLPYAGLHQKGNGQQGWWGDPAPVLNTTQQLSTMTPFPLLLPQVRRRGREMETKQNSWAKIKTKTEKGNRIKNALICTYSQHNHPPATNQHPTTVRHCNASALCHVVQSHPRPQSSSPAPGVHHHPATSKQQGALSAKHHFCWNQDQPYDPHCKRIKQMHRKQCNHYLTKLQKKL